MISAQEAYERLKGGNKRFASNMGGRGTLTNEARRAELIAGQEPFAIILGCSDSRVPAEIVFDQGLGDLFVIRVAGNIVAASQIGSVEYAVEMFHTPLVIVMGHSMCGAVTATVDQLTGPDANRSPNLRTIVDRIRPSVQPFLKLDPFPSRAALISLAIRANIKVSTDQLRHGSGIIEDLVQRQKLTIMSAEYSLETGKVEFIDSDPFSSQGHPKG